MYVVTWQFNGRNFEERFEFYHTALAKVLQLEAFKQKVTIEYEIKTKDSRISSSPGL